MINWTQSVDLTIHHLILQGMRNARERRETHIALSQETMEERDHLEGMGVDGRIILKSILNKQNAEMWTGLIWLEIGTSVKLM